MGSGEFFIDFFFSNVNSSDMKTLQDELSELDTSVEKQKHIDEFWYKQFVVNQENNPWENAQRKGAKTMIGKWGQKISEGGRIRGYAQGEDGKRPLVDYTSVYSQLKESYRSEEIKLRISDEIQKLSTLSEAKEIKGWVDKKSDDYLNDFIRIEERNPKIFDGVNLKKFEELNKRINLKKRGGGNVYNEEQKLLDDLKLLAEKRKIGTHKLKVIMRESEGMGIKEPYAKFEKRWFKKINLSKVGGKENQLKEIRNSMKNLSLNYDKLDVPVKSPLVLQSLHDKANEEINNIRKNKGLSISPSKFLIAEPVNVDREQVLSWAKEKELDDSALKRFVDESIAEVGFISPNLDRNTRNKEVYRKIIHKMPGVRTTGEEVIERFMEVEYGDKTRNPGLKDLEKINNISNKNWDLKYSSTREMKQKGYRSKSRDEILNDLITFKKSDEKLISSSTIKLKKIAKSKGISVETPKYVRDINQVVPTPIFSQYKNKLSDRIIALNDSDKLGKKVNLETRQFNDVVEGTIKEINDSFGFPEPTIPF